MQIKNRNYFRLTRFIILRLPPVFKFFSRFRLPSKRILVVKTDAIGDYILFRNFIEAVKKSRDFQDLKIDLIGNEAWAEMAVTFDADFIANFYFVAPDSLYERPGKMVELGWRLFKNKYQLVLHPTFARTLIGDGLATLAAGKETIAFAGDAERIDPKYKKITDRRYDTLLSLPPDINFEFDRNKFFFGQLLQAEIAIKGPKLPVTLSKRSGVVIFPGAGVSKRCWEKEKFLDILELIIKNSNHFITLAGGVDATETGKWLAERLPASHLINRIGKTSLTELIELISGSALVISNETSATHIAAATNTPSVCILGGGHFGRFAPYPTNMPFGPACVFERMSCFNCNWHCIYETPDSEPYPCISSTTIEKVWQQILDLLRADFLPSVN